MFVNRRRPIALLLASVVAVLALTVVTISSAEAAAKNRRAVAVIIGNSSYQGSTPAVDFALNDADAFKTFVVDVLGYDPENIIDLRDATQSQMETAFGNDRSHEGRLWRYIDPKGRSDVVVFYSGHGVPGLKDKRGYLLPVDADPEAPEINGYALDTLLANLGKLNVKSLSVFIDACFSGDSQKGMLIRSTSGITIVPDMPAQSSKMTLITAAQGDQVASWDNKAKQGLFTKHLLDALYGEADSEDYGNGDGKIALSEVREYLDDNMTRAARRQFGRHQNSWISGSEDNLLVASVSGEPRRRPVVRNTAPVVKKPVAVIKPKRVVKTAPPPRPRPVVKPDFDVAALSRQSTWRIKVDFKEIWGANFEGDVKVVNGRFNKTMFSGLLILDLWGDLRRGELNISGTVADRERFVHAPWGPAVETPPSTFETIVNVTGPVLNFNTVAGTNYSGEQTDVKVVFTLLRRS